MNRKDEKESMSERKENSRLKSVFSLFQKKNEEDWDETVEADASTYKKSVPYVLKQGKYSITFMVPDNYSWNQNKEPDIDEELDLVLFPRFTRENSSAIVDCRYQFEDEADVESGDYSDAEEYINDQLDYLSEKERKDVKIQQTVVEGKYIVYYFVRHTREGLDKYKMLYAVCEVERGKIFELEMCQLSWQDLVDIKEIEEFFRFQ